MGIALLVGTIVLADLHLLGLALHRYGLPEIKVRFRSWNRTGFAIMMITGPILFASDVTRYIHNPAFLVKMAFLAAALVLQFVEKRGKVGAAVSIALWSCVVLGGRAIADFDI